MGLVTSNDRPEPRKSKPRRVVVRRKPVPVHTENTGGRYRPSEPPTVEKRQSGRRVGPAQHSRERALVRAYESSDDSRIARDPLARFLSKLGGKADAGARRTGTETAYAGLGEGPGAAAIQIGGKIIPQVAKDLASMATGAIPGLIHLGEPGAHDLDRASQAAIERPLERLLGGRDVGRPGHGSLAFERSRRDYPEIGKQIAGQVVQDFAHPLRHPGYTAVDAGSLLTGGASLAGRGAAVGAALKEGAGAGAIAKAAIKRPPPETFPLTAQTDAGRVTVHRLLSRNPLAKQLQIRLNKARQARLNNPGRETRLGAPSKERLMGEYGYGERGASVLEKLMAPQAAIGRAVSRHLGPEATVARELRASRRVKHDIARAPVVELRHAAGPELRETPILDRLPKRLRKGISRGEQKAIQALSIFGNHALDEPGDAVRLAVEHHGEELAKASAQGREIEAAIASLEHGLIEAEHRGAFDDVAQMQQQLIAEETRLEEVNQLAERHERQVGDFKTALPALERLRAGQATPAFQKAVRLTQEVSERRQKLLMGHALLEPESAAFREAAPAAVYRGEPLTEAEHHVATLAERPPEVKQLAAEIANVDKRVEKLRGQYQRSAKRQRPRTGEEAKLELARLEREHTKLVDRFKDALMSHPVTPEQIAAELARIEAEVAKHEQTVEKAKVGIEQLAADKKAGVAGEELKRRHGAESLRDERSRVYGVVYGQRYSSSMKLAERKLRALRAERNRFVEAQKTGRLRVVHDPAETARRNLMRMHGTKVPTLAEELHGEALKTIEAAIARHPEHPSFKKFAAEQAAIERLREGLQQLDPIFGAGKLESDDAGHYFGHVPVGSNEKLRHQVETMLGYKAGLEARLEKVLGRDHPVQVLADETVHHRRELDQVPGAYRTPLRAPNKPRKVGIVYTAPGEYGVPLPKPSRRDPSLSHQFTGGEIKNGELTPDPVTSTIDSYLRGVQNVMQLEEYGTLWKLSHARRVHEGMVPIRDVAKVPLLLKRARRGEARNLPITKEDLQGLERGDLEALQRYLHPSEVDGKALYADEHGKAFNVPLGWSDPRGEVRWVDERYFERFAASRLPEAVRKAADAVNNPARFMQIYARGAYALNLISNYGMQALTQGWGAADNYRRAFKIREKYGERNASIMESLIGEGRSRAYKVETGFGSKLNDAVASFWAGFIDRQSRLSALIHQMKQHGVDVDDVEQVSRLLTSEEPRLRQLREQVVRRANKDMVEFNNLTPVERNIIRHLIFVYPWVSRATIWAGRVLVDHPLKSVTLGQLARVAERDQDRKIGQLPSYLKRRGYYGFKLGDRTFLVGTAPINPWQTAPEFLSEVKGAVTGADASEAQPSEALSPFLGGIFNLLGGAAGQHRQGMTGGAVGAFEEQLRSLPQVQAIRRAGVSNVAGVDLGPKPNTRRPPEQQPVFSKTGPFESIGPLLAGSVYAREANMDAAHAKARREYLESLPPDRRAAERVNERTGKWLAEARRIGLYGRAESWDEGMQQAIGAMRRREVMYAKRAMELDVPANRLSQHDRLAVDLDLMVALGLMGKTERDEEIATYQDATENELKNERRALATTYFGGDIIHDFRQTMRDAGSPVK